MNTPRSRSHCLFRCLALVLLALLPMACFNLSSGIKLPVDTPLDELPKTKAELFRTFGAPKAIVGEDDGGKVLYFRYKAAKGRTLGVLGIAPGMFGIGQTRTFTDELVFRVDADGKVVDGYAVSGTDKIPFRMWPGGDGGDD